MPKLDGIDAARRILDERPIPIVMVTAYGEQELVARAVEAGVFGYLVKPFRESDLLPAIETARARHEELAALREEAGSLAEALAARKAIERAKGLLMERESLSEQDAFARLRKASQISGRPLKVVAEAVIATLGRALGRCQQPVVLAPPARAAGPPHGECNECNGGEGDGERENHDRLPGEDRERLVERAVEARPGCGDPGALLGAEIELDRRVASGLGASPPGSREARGAVPAPARAAPGDVPARPPFCALERDVQRGDLRLEALELTVERVQRLLQVVDLDVLRDDRAETGEPRDRVCRACGWNAEGE